jgi:hypothetical protein
MRDEMRTLIGQNNSNIRQFAGTVPGAFARQANAPVRQQVQAATLNAQAQGIVAGTAIMIEKPDSLHQIYDEFEFGIGGRKPAKDFTVQERNNRANGTKQKWYRREIIYWMICQLTNRNYTVHAAIHKIQQAIGPNWSITAIINKAKWCKRTGNWPQSLECLRYAQARVRQRQQQAPPPPPRRQQCPQQQALPRGQRQLMFLARNQTAAAPVPPPVPPYPVTQSPPGRPSSVDNAAVSLRL